jgi:polysaccharide pyruvyl transferase WcaK-like protein
MTVRAVKPTRVAIFGHFDGTNLGNEATLQAFLHNLRRMLPDAEVTCICTGPRTISANYHIRALPIARAYLGSWAPENQLGKLARRFCVALGEPVRWVESIITLSSTDILIIPGTGLLTDAYGLTGWGPYSLFRWAVSAKICRSQLAFISVGAGPFFSAVGKFCVRSFLSMADFRSYRDEASVRCLQGIGISADGSRVFPDLAFSFPKDATPPREGAMGAGAVVGLGVMDWADRYSKHGQDGAAQSNYMQSFAKMAQWLLARGYKIRLLIGDFADAPAKQALLRLLGEYDSNLVIDEPIHSVDDLMSQIAATDAVVATRFHNTLLALLCEKPVISVSFHHKCESLMETMGMSDYCLNSGDLEPDKLIEAFRRLEQNAEALTSLIKDKTKEFQDSLDQQYQLVLSCLQSD